MITRKGHEGYEDPGAVYAYAKQHQEVYPFTEFPTFEELSSYIGDEIGEERLPYLDRRDIDESALSADQRYWRENGYIIFKRCIPDELIERYLDLRRRANLGVLGFPHAAPYDSFKEIRDLNLYRPLMQRIENMLGYRVALHFNLSGFTSCERGWHQDDYMADPLVAASGIALWFAFDTIHPDSGPFEYVPGSHRWPIMRRPKVIKYLTKEAYENRDGTYEFWAHLAEYFVNPACVDYMRRRGVQHKAFLAERGDVLVWHGGLPHRASHRKNPNLVRPSLIAHYCDPNRHHVGGGTVVRHDNGQQYITFPTGTKLRIENGRIVEVPPSRTVQAPRSLHDVVQFAGKVKAQIKQRLPELLGSP